MGTISEGAAPGPRRTGTIGTRGSGAPGDARGPASADWIDGHRGSIFWVARDYRHFGVPLEDLLAEGIVGLLEAAARFDPARGVKFVSYATWWIRKRIVEAVSRQAALVRLPRYRLRHLALVRAAEREAAALLGRPATSEEIARSAGMRTSDVDLLLGLSTREVPFGTLLSPDSSLSVEDTLPQQTMGSPDEELLREERLSLLGRILSRLPVRESQIVELRFGLDGRPPRTLADVSRRFGLSRERVRQLEMRALASLRRLLAEEQGEGRRRARPARRAVQA
jgi:RNA polymerase primary sigma factor